MSQITNIAKKISNKLFSDLPIGSSVRIAGTVHSYTVEEGTYGEYKRFKGEFAMSYKDEVFLAAEAFLPEIAANLLASGVVSGANEAGDGFKGTEFALDLFKNADSDPRNGRGYIWGVRPIVAPSATTSRALALLESSPVQRVLGLAGEVVETVAETVETVTETVKHGKKK